MEVVPVVDIPVAAKRTKSPAVKRFTVTAGHVEGITVTKIIEVPFIVPFLAIIVVFPATSAVTNPEAFIVATVELLVE